MVFGLLEKQKLPDRSADMRPEKHKAARMNPHDALEQNLKSQARPATMLKETRFHRQRGTRNLIMLKETHEAKPKKLNNTNCGDARAHNAELKKTNRD